MKSFAEHPYASFIQRVEKPARYLGGEFGSRMGDWDATRAKVCLAFPDVYDIGMSHLGFKILYRILNDNPGTLADRAYCPWVDMEKELRTRNVPLIAVESSRPLCDFDVVGFSLQFELTYTNILTMLDLGRIPLRGADRGEKDPLVIAGGPTATHPEPVAAFFDAIVIGDGEERITEIALLWVDLREKGLSRKERLQKLSELEGVYVPSLYTTEVDSETGFHVVARGDNAPYPVKRALVPDLNLFPFPDDSPVGGPEAIFDRMSIEIARGCTEGCRFCQAGMIYRPVRERDPEQIVDTIVRAVKKSGYDEASLTSLSTADYSCIAPLIKKVVDRLTPERVSLGVSSLRAYGLEENVLDDMQQVRASGVTFAPEAGSQRMRDVVNKNVTEEQLMTTAERIFTRGWSSMKLYFMIGLPTEEESDIREIVRVGARAREVGRKIKAKKNEQPPTITVSVSTHVPKPHTPFQWCAMDTQEEVIKKQNWLREEQRPARVELRMHDSEGSWLEGVLARGDRRIGNVVERAYLNGARFDSWDDQLKLDAWRSAFDQEGIDPGQYLGTIPITGKLPWDHIDVGLEAGFLAKEYKKAVRSRLSPPCGKAVGMFVHHSNLAEAETDKRKLVCYDCGVACDLGQMREERLVYLRKLGAEAPRPAAPPPVEMDDATRRRNKKKPPASFAQGEPRRYRFGFTKLGPAGFLSHLDLVRALPRAFRRCELPLFYSQGFHPKPDMTFGPALSLGVFSLEEFFDVKITADIDPLEFLSTLTEGSGEGIRFTTGVRLGPNDAAIPKMIDTVEYVVAVPENDLMPLGGVVYLDERIGVFLEKTEARLVRRIERIGKSVNVRSFVQAMARDESARELLEISGLRGSFVPIRVRVTARNDGSTKISEVMEMVFGSELPYHAVRTSVGRVIDGRIASPMELEKKIPKSEEQDAGAGAEEATLLARKDRAQRVDESGDAEISTNAPSLRPAPPPA